MSFPDTVSDSLCRNSAVVQTHSFISCRGGWAQTIPQVKKPDVKVLGWPGYMWSAVVRPVGRTAKLSKMSEVAYGREINITALVEIPVVSMSIVHSLNLTQWLCAPVQ